MIPFQKIFTLVIRTFSKPMLSYLKKKQQEAGFIYFAMMFRWIGRKYHHMEHWINYRVLKVNAKKQPVELKD